jgi:hypothetical protein
MRSKNSKAHTRDESEHMALVKSVACVVCNAEPPSSAHHIEQGLHFTTVALCWECLQGKQGIHGDKTLWRIYKITELGALNETLRRVGEIK